MARVSLILILLLWLGRSAADGEGAPAAAGGAFLGVYGVLLLGMRLWAWRLERRAREEDFERRSRAWSRGLLGARLLVVAWFGYGVYGLGWPATVTGLLARVSPQWLETPELLAGTLPALLTWLGLWWAGFPAERAIRGRRALVALESGWPVVASPTLGEHLLWNLRTNMLFLLAPIVAILALGDLGEWAVRLTGAGATAGVRMGMSGLAGVSVLVVAPALLVRILPTQRLAASPLRAQLEALCARHRLRYRDIRLWNSGGILANAAVMGVLPQVRYLLLTDLVVEAMPQEEVLAVFAHESGHVAKHHLAWLGVTVLTYALGTELAARTLMPRLEAKLPMLLELPEGLVSLALGLPLFILFFGYLSRCFERQADLFAARSMGGEPAHERAGAGPAAEGALVVARALEQIAALNHFNPRAWEWLHGSIASRCALLRAAAEEPQRARDFDRFMWRLCLGLLALLAVFSLALTRW